MLRLWLLSAIMGFSLNAFGNGNTSPANAVFTNLGGARGGVNATEANRQFQTRVTGLISGLAVQANNLGTALTVQFRKNGVNGNSVVTPTDTTAGVYRDTTHADRLAVQDLIDVEFLRTNAPTYYWVVTNFWADVNHATFYCYAGARNYTTASTAFFMGASGENPGTTTETITKILARHNFTIQHAHIYISAARATNSTVRSRIDTGSGSANGNIVYTVTGGATGLFEDSSNSDAIADGNYWNWTITTGTGVDTMTSQYGGCTAISTQGAKNDIFTTAGIARAAGAAATYHIIPGLTSDPSEALRKLQHGFPVKTSRFRIYLATNASTTNSPCALRKNGAAATQGFTITTLVAGLYEDTSNTDFFAATDDMGIEITAVTTGSLTTNFMAITEEDNTPEIGALYDNVSVPLGLLNRTAGSTEGLYNG